MPRTRQVLAGGRGAGRPWHPRDVAASVAHWHCDIRRYLVESTGLIDGLPLGWRGCVLLAVAALASGLPARRAVSTEASSVLKAP